MLLPGETFYGLRAWSYDNGEEWDSFTRRWRFLESTDPEFLLVSHTGFASMTPDLGMYYQQRRNLVKLWRC